MKKVGSHVLLLILLLIINCYAEKRYIHWRQIDFPEFSNTSLIEANSSTDFWVQCGFNLYHFDNNDWTVFSFLESRSYIGSNYLILDDANFICVAIAKDYKTHFYTYSNDKWYKYSTIANVPVRNLLKISSDNIWAFGDWGNIYHLVSDSWRQISSPIKNHITCHDYLPAKGIWLGVRSEGIYRFDGDRFVNIPIENYSQQDIQGIQIFDSGQCFAYLEGCIYKFIDNKFKVHDETFINEPLTNFYFDSPEYGIAFGNFGRIFTYDNGVWKKEALPIERNISNAIVFNDDSGILTGEKGLLCIGSGEPRFYFNEMAGSYNVEGSINDRTKGAALIDINEDDFPDLFVLNPSVNQYNRLYLNIPGMPFSDVTRESGLLPASNSFMFAFTDYNKDGRLDGAFMTLESGNLVIRFYDNYGDYRFKPRSIFNELIPGNIGGSYRDFEFVDYDRDNDSDLFLTLYYGKNRSEIGENILLKNRLYGKYIITDSIITKSGYGWNTSSLFSDFNGDDFLDIFISNYWINDKLLIYKNNNYLNESDERLPVSEISNSIGALAMDFDNDGDLDIFSVKERGVVEVYGNNGKGYFEDITNSIGFSKLLVDCQLVRNINCADFNNDGYIDIFLSGKEKGQRNWMFLNDSARCFVDVSDSVGVKPPYVNATVCGDIDNDGDLDIYGVRDGANVLWVNQIDNRNYLKIIPGGVISSTSGMHAKIWVYDAGHLDEPDHLRGYRQIGSTNFAKNIFNSPAAHFGVIENNKYDVKIRFYGRKTKIFRNVAAGQTLKIKEISGLISYIYRVPSRIVFLLRQAELYYYMLVFIFTIAFVYVTIRSGIKYFRWNITFIFLSVTIYLSIFWLLIIILKENTMFYKYLLPALVVYVGMSVLFISSYQIQKRKIQSLSKSANEELLKSLMIFSHGEWAMSNLNSLQLLCENIPDSDNIAQKFLIQLENRKETFFNMVMPNIEKIITISQDADLDEEIIENLQSYLDIIRGTSQKENLPFSNKNNCIKVGMAINNIKRSLRKIKDLVYKEFSCNAVNVIISVCESLDTMFKEKHITINRVKKDIEDTFVLIKNYELADILDNCLQNAVKAVRDSAEKRIDIILYKSPPKIHIDIKDNGIGISKDMWEKIFESGFSQFKSGGKGLYHARKILDNYIGRIYIKESSKNSGTTFTIELNEGRQK